MSIQALILVIILQAAFIVLTFPAWQRQKGWWMFPVIVLLILAVVDFTIANHVGVRGL